MEVAARDLRCSNACIRAGVTAFIISAISISLLQPLDRLWGLDALLKYFSMRLTLKDEVERLEQDPTWKVLRGSDLGGQAARDWNLGRLLEYRVADETPAALSPLSEKERLTRTEPPPAMKKRPAAPTGLGLLRGIDPLHAIVDTLVELGDGNLLSRARGYSYRHDRSIYRWAGLHQRRILEAKAKGRPIVTIPSTQARRPRFVPSYSREELLTYLTLPTIIELANYEPISLSEAEVLQREQGNVNLPPIGGAMPLIPASTFIEIGLLLSSLYFFAYYREARRSEAFPVSATLFGVFARTRLFRLMFRGLLAVPAICAALLASKSFWIVPGNAFIAALAVMVAVMIQREGGLPSASRLEIRD